LVLGLNYSYLSLQTDHFLIYLTSLIMIQLNESQQNEIQKLIGQNRRIEAVKKVWSWSRAGMKASKAYVDRIIGRMEASQA
jgi:hypothetical protein